jgi:hypothetical protein
LMSLFDEMTVLSVRVVSRRRKRTTSRRIRHRAGFQERPDAGRLTLRLKRCSPVAKHSSPRRF